MASNTQLNSGTGGDIITTKERTHDGDATKQQGVFLSGVTGTEGAYTFTDVQAGGGTEAAALRVTIASDSTGVLSVDDNGGSITVDGTITANLAAGTNNIGDVDILSIAAGDNNIGNVDVVTLPALPAGTNNIGDVDVLSLVPGTGATSLGKAVDSAAGATDTGVALLAIRDDALTTLTPVDGDYVPLRTSSTGALHVNVAAGGIAGIVDDAAFTPATSEVLPVGFTFDDTTPDTVNEGDIGAARMSANRCIYVNVRDNAGNERGLNVDASGNIGIAANSAVNVAQMNGTAVTMGNGASGTGVQRVTLANDSTGVLATVSTVTTVTNITNQGQIADDAAFTAATTRVNMAGFFADETATDSVDEGDGGAARMTLDRKQIVTSYVHAGAGGATPYQNLDVDETEDDVKTSAGKVYWIHAFNLHASAVRYLKFYDLAAASVVVGTTTPVLTLAIPPTSNGFAFNFGDVGVQFSTAICIAATTGFAVADTGAPGANEVIVNLGYV